MKSLKANIIVSLLIATLVSTLAYFNPTSLQKFDTNFIDLFLNIRGESNVSSQIAIVDIDEKSLKALGQWPWSRDKISLILENLNSANMGILGFDMIFAESDRSSPKQVLEKFGYKDERAKDFDEVFAKTLLESPAILGFVLNFEQNLTNTPPRLNTIFIEKNRDDFNNFIPQAMGVTTNLPILQKSAYSAGSFNMIPDLDGVVRYVPMLFRYSDSLYPSLSLEMIRAMLGVKVVKVIYDENGVESIEMGELKIPTDRYGRVFVNYRGPKKMYNYISALDIYNNTFKKEDIEGKILLLGTSSAGLMDLRSTPLDSTFPGVEIHANVIDNIINSDFLQKPSFVFGKIVLIIFISIILLSIFLTFLSPLISMVFSIFYIASMLYGFYYEMFQNGIVLNILYPFIGVLLTLGYIFLYKLITESKQKELIRDKFSKKVSPQIVDELMNSEVALETKEKVVTIFFSDIRDFTTISECFDSPKELIEFINSYLSPISDIILKERGTIDKYIGDAVMAYWNAPLDLKNHADHALSSAILQLQELDNLNIGYKKQGYPAINIGIGLHTGLVTVGEMGSVDRSDFTIIGDSVNLGSRLEGLTKFYGAKIIISEDTKKLLTKKYKIRELDRVQVKGKSKSITIFEVLGFGDFSDDEKIIEKRYIDALNLYKNAKFDLSAYEFEKLGDTTLYNLYAKRCKELQGQDIEDFDGVYKFTTK